MGMLEIKDRVAELAERLSKGKGGKYQEYIVTVDGKQYTRPPERHSPDLVPVADLVQKGQLPPFLPRERPTALTEYADKYIVKPFAAGLTQPLYSNQQIAPPPGQVPSTLGGFKDYLYRSLNMAPPGSPEMQRYEQWQDPMLKLGPVHIGVKGVAESLPYMAIPAAGQVAPGLRAVKGVGILAKTARVGGEILKPVEALEQLPGKVVGKVAEKFKPKVIPTSPSTSITTPKGLTAMTESAGTQTAGTVTEDPVTKLARLIKSAEVPREETELLKHQEMKQRVGRVAGVQEKTTGLQGYYKAQSQLKGELPQAKFQPPIEQFSPEDVTALFEKPKEFWKQQVISGDLPKWKLILTVQNTQTALKKLLVDGVIPQEKELELLTECYGPKIIEAILARRSMGAKAWATALDIAGLPRALQSSFDYSMPLRQAVYLTIAHPGQSIPNLGRMFRASVPLPEFRGFKPFEKFKPYVGEEYTKRLQKEIFNRPHAQVYQKMKIDFTTLSKYSGLTSREETFQTRLANWIPGIKQSQQNALTYVNQMRADIADLFINKWEKEGYNYTTKDLESLGKYINIGTGRGDVGALKGISPALNTLLYSTRLIASRVELPYLLVTATPAVRKEMIRDLAISASLGVTILSALKLSGAADVQLNPRSTDFGKIRVGNTRLDIWGGFQPYVRLIIQLAGTLGQFNMKTTAKTQYGTSTYWQGGGDMIWRFIMSKGSPAAGFTLDLMNGKNFIGQEMDADKATVAREAWSRFMPFFVQDMVDAIHQEGLVGGFMASPGLFGTGTQSYETGLGTVKSTLQEKLANQLYGVPYAELDKADKTKYTQRNAIRDDPEMEKLNLQIKEQESETKEETPTNPYAKNKKSTDTNPYAK